MSQPAVLFAMGLSPKQRERNLKVGHNQNGLRMTCGYTDGSSTYKMVAVLFPFTRKNLRWMTRGRILKANFNFKGDGDIRMRCLKYA